VRFPALDSEQALFRRKLELEIRQQLNAEFRAKHKSYIETIDRLTALNADLRAQLADQNELLKQADRKLARTPALEEQITVGISDCPEVTWTAPRSRVLQVAGELLQRALANKE
jgi:hypothetical protein